MTVVDTVVTVPEDRGRPSEPPTRHPGEPIVIPVSNPDLGRDWDPNDTLRREEMYDDDGR